MDHSTHNRIVSFIWSMADDCLRDVFIRGKYRDVILPTFDLRRILAHFGDRPWNDSAAGTGETKAALKKLKLKPGAPQLKQILDAVSWRDPEALPIVATELQLEVDQTFDFKGARTWCSEIDGSTCTTYEPDSELRDTENVRMS